MVRLVDGDDGQGIGKYPVIDQFWLADKERKERDEVFDDTVRAFLERSDDMVVVEYEPASEGVTYLLAAIKRLGVDSEARAYEDAGRIILKKTT